MNAISLTTQNLAGYVHTRLDLIYKSEGDQVVRRASTGVIHCVFDQIPNVQNCFATPNKNHKNLGGEGSSDI
jgi:hypothetical protein